MVFKFFARLTSIYRTRATKVEIESSDILILADAFWTYDFETAVRSQTQHSKFKIFSIVYDVIPLSHPHLFEDYVVSKFGQSLPKLLKVSDYCLTISNFVADELKKYASSQGFKTPPCSSFTLGSDFDIKGGLASPVVTRPGLLTSFGDAGTPMWLVVSTIEPRKNHAFILDAFEILWDQGQKDHLVLVGRTGWKCESFLQRLHSHPMYGVRLFHFWDLSDAELYYTYKAAHGLIFASVVEGFGLPLIEAITMNIPVICSDIPVFREVAGNYPRYFSLSGPQNLVAAILQPIERCTDEELKQKSLKTWQQATDEFFEIIERQLVC